MKSRWVTILLYFLSFCLIFVITSVVIVNAYYAIPYDSGGIILERTFSVSYDLLFGIIAFFFSILATYSFLSIFGSKKFSEVFFSRRRKLVYISTFLTFMIVYFMFELLVGYIVLNIKNPNAFVNGNTSNSIVIESDKNSSKVYLDSSTNNTNMFVVGNGNSFSLSDSNLNHSGNGSGYNNPGKNTIIYVHEGATFNGDRIMLNLRGAYSEALYVHEGTMRIFNSNVLTKVKNSIPLYGYHSNIYVNSSSFSSNSENAVVLRNGSEFTFDNSIFDLGDVCKEIFILDSSSEDETNVVNIRNSNIDTANYHLFKIKNSKNIINFEEVKLDWGDIESYLATIDKSDVTINIKNSNVSGNFYLDDVSNLKINLINSEFSGNIVNNKGFELTMDDVSLFTSKGNIHLFKFNGSEMAFKKVISIQNQVILDTNN